MTNLNKLKVVVIGSSKVGKSAVTVRYLTKRYIGEYSSSRDFLYRHSVIYDNITNEVEILDTSRCDVIKRGCLYEHLRWGDAFVVVYSICDKGSFEEAADYLIQLTKLKLPSYYTILLLGNKSDLDHAREISVHDGQELSLRYSCQFYEVSAAENVAGVSLAFQSLIREARSTQLFRAIPLRRKLGVNSVSKALGNIFGKNSKGERKKRPSLSI
ncbi:ras-related and estrogen-regulated growth inhibitor-like isoform X1 [Uranotaenia lowii]|uniref:ras-related and estrogen-regulated growth inhibitor-like isoform X1 n=1 Tax=Uranotaenia lowii TaxID=190385 RepID=UPI0024797547|nr:ras-related and estrogen-regulated growth inhibitor-like isoform X1 [Uranotaenia lowii]XP_055588099.1 ras-related and estrogen-regulated growth inhibitor-like isoform X1 [Uranotaenia lowii]XP_055588101.1 ras-related and estrogen-regulated growth inhibitor-like isoform X1 [Uranotaenia lowii]XP_055588102.1 ras-related and estrogen-regulated growth inhibitor-like isoform X1 [Uranotaenia lowii]XP_055588103.1 ras-related and estrogen-regulated growth inhibitor-like isoform X1 [Uranotaenia lowii]